MAVKLDMEQAYDSMGWSTLNHILLWYGFTTAFSKLLEECLINARFSIILNEKYTKWIDAHYGFRQGCSQLLSNSIEQRGQEFGIQVSPGGPRITHLLYADDMLLFSWATTFFGQKVNVNKSQIIFSKIIKRSHKNIVANILGFWVVKELQYLGIKISLQRLGEPDFQDLLSHVSDRLNYFISDTGEWDEGKLLNFFHENLVNIIRNLHIDNQLEDQLEIICNFS
ncbi:uncharacterized protein LOC110105100, partial [Dendrobium catenatum]|uniref:uncharacterized protein LOC110105100 n=1 Tax=Dendrobium catenatum TaxID=906689 RepID=UPI0009F386E0